MSSNMSRIVDYLNSVSCIWHPYTPTPCPLQYYRVHVFLPAEHWAWGQDCSNFERSFSNIYPQDRSISEARSRCEISRHCIRDGKDTEFGVKYGFFCHRLWCSGTRKLCFQAIDRCVPLLRPLLSFGCWSLKSHEELFWFYQLKAPGH